MFKDWDYYLERWAGAGLVEAETAARIRAWEKGQNRTQGLRWPVILALVLGGLLVGAGVLLFVSAQWDQLSPWQRMGLVSGMVAVFHLAGAAVAGRFAGLSVTLHTVGTVALGGGIALAGEIFNLQAHWPYAYLWWALGAALAWWLLGHWTQGALTAILAPAWLAAEWGAAMSNLPNVRTIAPAAAGICALSFVYLAGRRSPGDSVLRKALGWAGGIALIPAAFLVAVDRGRLPEFGHAWFAWVLAAAVPLAASLILRGREFGLSAAAVGWTLLLAPIAQHSMATYLWLALGSVGLAAWGIREARVERVNLGMGGFALTVLAFYFANVMGKLERSASLMGLGLLFLGGGWLLERTRRRLVAQVKEQTA